VKVGDTTVDIAEARNAGAWAVAVLDSGNAIGRSASDFAALPDSEKLRLRAIAKAELRDADYVIETLAELPAILRDIDGKLRMKSFASRSPGL
ncbi:MAG: hypothetical protein SFV23_26400, partial [Planctomycetaceae bacterium]|nr:hypothetical protein [Planctomycetaceae bacterium]